MPSRYHSTNNPSWRTLPCGEHPQRHRRPPSRSPCMRSPDRPHGRPGRWRWCSARSWSRNAGRNCRGVPHPGHRIVVPCKILDVLMVRDMLIRHRHLAPTDAGSDVRHAVVIPNLLVLIVGIVLAVLSRVHHYFVPGVLIGCDERAVILCR